MKRTPTFGVGPARTCVVHGCKLAAYPGSTLCWVHGGDRAQAPRTSDAQPEATPQTRRERTPPEALAKPEATPEAASPAPPPGWGYCDLCGQLIPNAGLVPTPPIGCRCRDEDVCAISRALSRPPSPAPPATPREHDAIAYAERTLADVERHVEGGATAKYVLRHLSGAIVSLEEALRSAAAPAVSVSATAPHNHFPGEECGPACPARLYVPVSEIEALAQRAEGYAEHLGSVEGFRVAVRILAGDLRSLIRGGGPND